MVFAFFISRFYLTSLSPLAAWMPPSVKDDMSKNIALLCLQRKFPVKQRIFVTFRL
jgi:hypothetical protein